MILLFYAQEPANIQPSNCDLKKNADEIKVYTCKTENEKFRTLKANFALKNINFLELENFILSVDNYPTWQYNMLEAEIIQPINNHVISYRSVVDAPWPVENREMIIKLIVTRDEPNQRMYIETENFDSSLPVKDGVIRIPFMHGLWTVTKNNNDLQVEYVLQIDPGGSVPAWLVNMAMAEGPYVSFKNLRNQLEK